MLQSLKITGLFGRFDYDLSFKEKIMIITGPNGYGKSTILRIIDNLCNDSDSFEKVLSYTFNTLTIVCKKGTLKITKDETDFKINEFKFPLPKYNQGKRMTDFSSFIRRKMYDDYFDIKVNAFGELSKLSSWDDDVFKQKFLSIRNTLEELPLKDFQKKIEELHQAIESMEPIIKDIGKVHFIQEQRLIAKRTIPENERRYGQSDVKYFSVINENSKNLKAELAEIMKQHSQLSSKLDGDYIKRLFENKTEVSNNLSGKLKKLQKKQEKLQQYGLAEIQNVSYLNGLLKKEKEKLKKFEIELSIYLEDANAKYQIFKPIIDKLELYEKIVNEKLAFKKMYLSSTDGIVVKTDDGNPLSLNALSSGEQEILVLFYKLIFESDVNLLLIDEPEISLHVVWQNELMENLKSVVKLKKNIRVVIATHSPQIISDNWDLQIDLGERYNG